MLERKKQDLILQVLASTEEERKKKHVSSFVLQVKYDERHVHSSALGVSTVQQP